MLLAQHNKIKAVDIILDKINNKISPTLDDEIEEYLANIDKIFDEYKPSVVVNLAAQAGVRYYITNPRCLYRIKHDRLL